jgi:hypothetical protein
MVSAQPTLVERLVRPLLLSRELPGRGVPWSAKTLHLGQCEHQEAQILSQPTPDGQGIRRRVGNGLLMGAAAIRVTQEEDEKQRLDEQDVFDHMVSFLPALTRMLFSRVLGADDALFGPVMGKRGALSHGWLLEAKSKNRVSENQ